MTYLKIGQWIPVVPTSEGARSDNSSSRRYYKGHDSICYSSEEEAQAIIKSPEAQAIKGKMVIIRGENENGDLTIAQGRSWLRVRYKSGAYFPSMLVDIAGNDVWLPIHDVIMSS